jgi:hypothetical protein
MQWTRSEPETEAALCEVEYLLKKWRFAMSSGGFLWIQPTGKKLSPEELAGFILLLRRGCAGDSPRTILFDFSEADIVGGQWTLVESLLSEFSHTIGARCRLIAATGRPLSAVLLYRKDVDMGIAERN